MFLDVSSLLSGETNVLPIDEQWNVTLDIPDVTFPEPLHVVGQLVNQAGYITLKLDLKLPYQTHCARCLEDVSDVFSDVFEKTVSESSTIQNTDSDDYLIIEDSKLDIASPVTEQVILDFPTKILCSDECLGLCPKCGCNLNQTKCGCVLKEPDPRFDVLRNLFREK